MPEKSIFEQISNPQEYYTDGYGVQRPVHEKWYITPLRKFYNAADKFLNGSDIVLSDGTIVKPIGGAGIADLVSPAQIAALQKLADAPDVVNTSVKAAKAVSNINKGKRARIVKDVPKKAERVFIPKQQPVQEIAPTFIEKEREADLFIDHLDKTGYLEGTPSPAKTKSVVKKAIINGIYGPSKTTRPMTVSQEVRNIKDVLNYGPHSKFYDIDRNLKNATKSYDIIGVNYKEEAPEISMQSLNAALNEATKLIKH